MLRGKLSAVDLLIKVASFVTKVNFIFILEMNGSKPARARWSTVLSIPLQLVFPDL